MQRKPLQQSSIISLTEAEVIGLNTKYNFADGHAYHEMPNGLQPVIESLPQIWEYARTIPIPEMEKKFKNTWADLIESPTLRSHSHFSICPTASNSIDVVATWLEMHNKTVGLLEPVFDNLYLILKRRNVSIFGIQEHDLIDLESLEYKIGLYGLTSLFIVSPNNPTGFQLSDEQYVDLCVLCSKLSITLIIDKTFRLYSKKILDDYKTLEDSGIDYVVIEDTGKTFPTQDTKASLIVYSEKISKDMRMLYEEIFLCSSNFTLALIEQLVSHTKILGLNSVVWSGTERRLSLLKKVIEPFPLTLSDSSNSCILPVSWISCSKTEFNDLELSKAVNKYNVAVLPGRFFYWNSPNEHTSNIRISLLKPEHIFYQGMEKLSQCLPYILGNIEGSEPVHQAFFQQEYQDTFAISK